MGQCMEDLEALYRSAFERTGMLHTLAGTHHHTMINLRFFRRLLLMPALKSTSWSVDTFAAFSSWVGLFLKNCEAVTCQL